MLSDLLQNMILFINILLTSYTHISRISGWCPDAQNTRTLITQVNLAQIILYVFHILTYTI